jgi:hypothetical protein
MARHASSPAIAIGGDCERNFTAMRLAVADPDRSFNPVGS